MARNSWLALVTLPALMLVGSCTSATGPSPGALAGRYVLTESMVTEFGYTVVADTLVLGPDDALRRSRVLHRSTPPYDVYSLDMGSYSVRDHTVVLRFSCRSGVCIGETTLDATAVVAWGRVVQLVLEENGRKETFGRVN